MRIDQFNNSTPVAPAVGDRVAAARLVSSVWTNYPLPAEAISAAGCQPSVAAAGSSQSTATVLTGFTAVITSGGGGVLLPTPTQPTFACVVNESGSTQVVYVPVGCTLGASGDSASLASGSALILLFVSATQAFTVHNGT